MISMSIALVCPGCETQLRVAQDAAGGKAKCPQCGTIMEVPSPEESTAFWQSAPAPAQSPETTVSHVPGTPTPLLATPVPRGVGDSTSVGRRFVIIRPHAEGGLGRVYLALDQELRREVALK